MGSPYLIMSYFVGAHGQCTAGVAVQKRPGQELVHLSTCSSHIMIVELLTLGVHRGQTGVSCA